MNNELILKAVFDEPELPGNMPDEMWEALKGNREATQIALQETVRQTKSEIIKRLTAVLSAMSPSTPQEEKP